MKVQVSLDDELVQRIDLCAESMYTSRSGFIAMSCVQFLNQNELIAAINRMSYAFKMAAEKGYLEQEAVKQWEEMERLFSMIAPK